MDTTATVDEDRVVFTFWLEGNVNKLSQFVNIKGYIVVLSPGHGAQSLF